MFPSLDFQQQRSLQSSGVEKQTTVMLGLSLTDVVSAAALDGSRKFLLLNMGGEKESICT
ncbi:MAG: hypothetical protein QXV14_02650 [Candidatus Caldarchaeum sp.]